MTKEEILHLGNLARIKLSEEEVNKFHSEIESILQYVGQVQKIASETDSFNQVGAIHNVFREDEITNEPGSYTDDLVNAFPDKKGNYLKVKKILNPDS